MWENVILVAVIGLIVGVAVGYIVRQKRKGNRCIGCPYGASCPSGKSGCGCGKQK